MIPRIHVIAGLPRSGSTLLAALLRQNPRTHAAMSSPLWTMLSGLADSMGPAQEFSLFLTSEQRANTLRGAFAGYLSSSTFSGRDLVFDTNRLWGVTPELLAAIDPAARFLVCVRDVGQIVNSVERLVQSNPLHPSALVGGTVRNGLLGRIRTVMSDEGMVGGALLSTRSLLQGPHASKALVVRYGSLVQQPVATLEAVYRFLGEPVFAHDPEHLVDADPLSAAFDTYRVGTPGLHRVPERVHTDSLMGPPLLPAGAYAELSQQNFWEQPNGVNGAVVV